MLKPRGIKTLSPKLVKIVLIVYAIKIALALSGDYLIVCPLIDRSLNTVHGAAAKPSQRAMELHRSLFIVDLHADSLLWDRDLLVRNTRGHVDVPRLIEGNVALQAFTIVTRMPFNLNTAKVGYYNDEITLLSIVQRWPPTTWFSLKERALFQADKLNALAARSKGRLTLIKSAADLKTYIAHRKTDTSCTAGFLGVEGAHALEGDLNNIEVFYEHGIRMIAPSHFFDNDIGGSSHGYQRN